MRYGYAHVDVAFGSGVFANSFLRDGYKMECTVNDYVNRHRGQTTGGLGIQRYAVWLNHAEPLVPQ